MDVSVHLPRVYLRQLKCSLKEDNDGFISFADYHDFLEMNGVDQDCTSVDKNQDGKISFEEFSEFYKKDSDQQKEKLKLKKAQQEATKEEEGVVEGAAVFETPSNTWKKFLQWRRGQAETPHAYYSALMALGQAVYPRMDLAALDSLTMEKLLVLAHETGIVLPVVDEEAQTSLRFFISSLSR
ncbi:unnamed protein product [Lampetra planeri]